MAAEVQQENGAKMARKLLIRPTGGLLSRSSPEIVVLFSCREKWNYCLIAGCIFQENSVLLA
jgi:hypothetical protein